MTVPDIELTHNSFPCDSPEMSSNEPFEKSTICLHEATSRREDSKIKDELYT